VLSANSSDKIFTLAGRSFIYLMKRVLNSTCGTPCFTVTPYGDNYWPWMTIYAGNCAHCNLILLTIEADHQL